MVKKVTNKCCHCGDTRAILLILNPTSGSSKVICVPCFCTRHPQTSLVLLETLLDAEVNRVDEAPTVMEK